MNNAKGAMGKSRSKIITVIATGTAFALLGLHSAFAIDANASLSDIRKERIAHIIKEFFDAKENLSDHFIQEAILDKVASEMDLEPDAPPVSKNLAAVASEVRKAAAERYPWTIQQVKTKAAKEAKEKYKPVDKGEYVTIHVQRGRKTETISDIFYGFGIGGNSVRIGDKLPIAFVDLLPVDRAKFDASFRKQQQKKYIQQRVRAYYRLKSLYSNELFQKKLKDIAQENEKRGYIRAWGEWRTPKSVTERFIAQYIKQQPPQETLPSGPDTAMPGDDESQQTATDTAETLEPSPEPASKPTMGLEAQLAKVRDEIEKRQIEIASSRYGVDADQGFEHGDTLVLMGCSSKDVNMLLKKQLPPANAAPKNGNEAITYETGPVASVTFYYINDILYKIVEQYRIAPIDIMQALLRKTVDDYGKSIETKEFNKKESERLARLKKIKNLCPAGKHKFNKKGVCITCGVKKADLKQTPEPLEQFHHWKGDVVSAELHFKLSSDKSKFELFELTREMPGLKKEQEAILEEERQKREEENKKKIRDQYNLE